MPRALIAAAAAMLLLGAAKPETVDYRLSVIPQAADAPPLAEVEMRFRGDADGETRLALPEHYGFGKESWRYLSDITVKGAKAAAPDAAHRVLTHKPGAKITVRYRVRSAYDADPPASEGNTYRGPLMRPDWFALIGDFVFAAPEGRDTQAATFKWGKLPKGWRVASDLEHAAMGRPMSVADVVESISLGGARAEVVERAVPGGTLRLVKPTATDVFPADLADRIAGVIAAQRGFWADQQSPYLVALIPLAPPGRSSGGTGRGDGFILYAAPGATDRLPLTIAHEHTHTWIAARVGRMPAEREAEAYWLSEGFTDFFAIRTLARGGLITPKEAVEMLSDALRRYDRSAVRSAPASRIAAEFWTNPALEQLPYDRGNLLALKWDEDVRKKSGGKLDLDDVILRMRDHYQRFAPGTGPDVVTGIISAAFVTADLDLRADVDRYAVKGEVVPLPETLFDGCVELRWDRRPVFDAGLDVEGSRAAKALKGVRTRGPAWTSGLRNGMKLDALTLKPGDTTVEVVATVRDARGRARTIRYWPYGDAMTETRSLALKPGMSAVETVACGKKIGGL